MDAVQEWIQVRKDYPNGVQRDDYPAGMDISTARQQLGMMGGAAFDAVKTMQIDAENREAATKALVGFVIDVGLSVVPGGGRSEEHTSELQSLMRISYAVFCLKKKKTEPKVTPES